jgi:hypothetical protein
MLRKTQLFVMIVVPLALIASLVGCSVSDDEGDYPFPMASLELMPPVVQHAAKPVQQAYRFAVANPQVLSQIPCFCGCGGMGHKSNLACFVGQGQNGTTRFDGHALGCSICVDIALDTMRMLKEGRSVPEIRLNIDAMYSRYGPSNMI